MRISFDVDDTLVCRSADAPTEPGIFPSFLRRRFGEPLRLGTRALILELRRRGHSVWIYTSSIRTPLHIRTWLFLHGIRVDGIINEQRHRLKLAGKAFPRLPSKYPPAFDIDLHVDDSAGVQMEGAEHGFQVIIIRPDDQHWAKRILDAVNQIRPG